MNKINDIKKEVTQEDRQELLNELVAKDMSILKKICFKYQHRALLQNKLIIFPADLNSISACGLYEKVDANKDNQFIYTHKISVNNDTIDEYFIGKHSKWYTQTYCKKAIKKVIRHELCHALAREIFSDYTNISEANADSSPLFLSLLYFLKGTTNHDCRRAWWRSELYKKTKTIKTFEELHFYLIHQLLQYEKVTFELARNYSDNIITLNTFSFASRYSGLLASSSTRDIGKDMATGRVLDLSCNHFEIGCCIMPQDIEKLVNKKINNGNFKNIATKKSYVKDMVMLSIEDGKLTKIKIETAKAQ